MTELLSFIPESVVAAWFFIFGIIIGSFLNVYLYRFHTNKSLLGSSHCLSCATPLKPYELVPLFSYLGLRGRCRTCHSYIPPRYFMVELVTGLLFLGLAILKLSLPVTAVLLLVITVLVVIAVYDLYHMIIPDELTIAMLVLAFSYNLLLLIGGLPIVDFFFGIFAAIGASLFLFILWKVSDGKWIGFGDVKLIVPIALLVGYAQVFSLVVLSFWIGAGIGLLLLALQKLQKGGKYGLRLGNRKLTIKSAVPFAPFMILSYLTILFFDIDVVALLTYV